jgi:GxxExxY protein
VSTFLHGEITKEILGAAFAVQKELGYGFLEKVYENSMVIELQQRGMQVRQQVPIDAFYKDHMVGHYIADLFVADSVIVELKAERTYNSRHEAQLLHYLKATRVNVGMLLNFGELKCEYKRLVL